MAVISVDKKIKEYKGQLTPQEHQLKQKQISRWKKYTNVDNSDVARYAGTTGSMLLVRLTYMTALKAPQATIDVGLDIYENNGDYWGYLGTT